MTSPDPRPAGRDDLPDCVVSAKTVPLGSYNLVELDDLAARPQRTLDVPQGVHPPGVARRMQNLAQYGGRSLEGQRRSLANLRRRISEPVANDAPQLPVHVPQPTVPTAVVRQISAKKAGFLRSVLSKEEYDLYVLTWAEWFEANPDYDQPSDVHDVETICMEAVIQYRVNLFRQRYPSRDYSNEYNQSYLRQQRAKENLAARRVDRVGVAGGKGGGGRGQIINNGNLVISVAAGSVDEKRMMELQQQARSQAAGDLAFLGGTKDNAVQIARLGGEDDDEVIDAEFTEPAAGGNDDE